MVMERMDAEMFGGKSMEAAAVTRGWGLQAFATSGQEWYRQGVFEDKGLAAPSGVSRPL
jgi:hypothetical protein